MTSTQPSDGWAATSSPLEFVPQLRTDFARRDIGGESVVWSPSASEPTALDAVSTLMLDVVDGVASIGELATEVHEEIDIPLETAQRRITAMVEQFAHAHLLTSEGASSSAEEAIALREVFFATSTPCSENASRLGTVTLYLNFGGQTVRVACDSRRGARKLRDALAEFVVDDDDAAPLAFVLTAPQGLHRNHRLVDRSGFVLSEGRGLDSGLHALASHLTALVPPAAGTVRIRTRGIVAGDRTILCLFPLLYFPVIGERDLAAAGLGLIDRLAVDVQVETGLVANLPIPWPALADLAPGPAHVGTGRTGPADAIISADAGLPAPTQATVAAALAANGTDGSRSGLLDAAIRLVQRAEVRTTSPEPKPLTELLKELGTGS